MSAGPRPFLEPHVRFPAPRLVRAEEQVVLDVALPSLDLPGCERRWHRGVRTERSFARRVTVPPGGGTPIHAVTCDHVIVQLVGEVDFCMKGERFRLGPGDLFYFPANVLYSIENPHRAEAALVSVGIDAGYGWPPISDYWSEPDEPGQAGRVSR